MAEIKLCRDCQWFVPEGDSPELLRKKASFYDAACVCQKIVGDLVTGIPRVQMCYSQRHVSHQVAHIWQIVPQLWCGPEGKYWEAKNG